jgi:mannosyl-3-phosphoglycerate phosphatase
MQIVFTDLDGTLLDHETYAWEAARAAIDRLRERGIPWIFVTSKTRAETEHWRRLLGNEHPYVVENGAAAWWPPGYFPGEAGSALVWGLPYAEVLSGLAAAARQVNCRIRGFHQMSHEEVAAACNLPLDLAVLARQREFDEPFELLDATAEAPLEAALARHGLRLSRGGRFYHASGPADKAGAVLALKQLYEKHRGPVTAIGLGDALNDLEMLRVVDRPVIVRSAQSARLARELPHALLTEQPGPAGWNHAILALT